MSWALDGGALHLYDFAGEPARYPALVRGAHVIARALFAAVLTATLYEDDPTIELLRRSGFERDATEPDVRAGDVTRVVALVSEVS